MRTLQGLFIAILTATVSTGVSKAETSRPQLTDIEKLEILSHGPWPPQMTPDHSNRFSGNPEAIDYGRYLFHSPKLSRNEILSCSGCHQPERNFMDGVALNRGHMMLDRNTPSLINLRWQNWFGWDGANDNLWAQSIRPILMNSEMDLSAEELKGQITSDSLLACGFRKSFGTSVEDVSDEDALVLIGKALAAYQETLISPPTAFDHFVIALDKDDNEAMAQYPDSALRGLKIFVGKGNCSLCHFGPLFTTGEFANIGMPYFIRKGVVDRGRFGGITAVKLSPYNLLGDFSDDTGHVSGLRTRHVAKQYRNWGEFKIPSLRNVSQTAPYMHNGSLGSLEAVIDHYSELNEERLHADGERILRPLNLPAEEKADLKAFLDTLSVSLDPLIEDASAPYICEE